MSAGRILRGLLILAAGIGIGYVIFGSGDRTETLEEAVTREHVSLGVHADNETSATFRLQKLSGFGKLSIVIPAGTIISNSAVNGQWLITAREVVVTLTNSDLQTKVVETYCAHQFADPPRGEPTLWLATTFSSNANEGGVAAEEVEPLHRLADCLSGMSANRGDRELAVWMVADRRTERTYDDVRANLLEKFKTKAQAELQAEMQTTILAKLREAFPGESEAVLQQEVNTYIASNLETRTQIEAEKNTDEELRGFVERAKPLLDSCGNNTGAMQFFQTAPAI